MKKSYYFFISAMLLTGLNLAAGNSKASISTLLRLRALGLHNAHHALKSQMPTVIDTRLKKEFGYDTQQAFTAGEIPKFSTTSVMSRHIASPPVRIAVRLNNECAPEEVQQCFNARSITSLDGFSIKLKEEEKNNIQALDLSYTSITCISPQAAQELRSLPNLKLILLPGSVETPHRGHNARLCGNQIRIKYS